MLGCVRYCLRLMVLKTGFSVKSVKMCTNTAGHCIGHNDENAALGEVALTF